MVDLYGTATQGGGGRWGDDDDGEVVVVVAVAIVQLRILLLARTTVQQLKRRRLLLLLIARCWQDIAWIMVVVTSGKTINAVLLLLLLWSCYDDCCSGCVDWPLPFKFCFLGGDDSLSFPITVSIDRSITYTTNVETAMAHTMDGVVALVRNSPQLRSEWRWLWTSIVRGCDGEGPGATQVLLRMKEIRQIFRGAWRTYHLESIKNRSKSAYYVVVGHFRGERVFVNRCPTKQTSESHFTATTTRSNLFFLQADTTRSIAHWHNSTITN